MLVQWYADIDGEESKIVPRLVEILNEAGRANGAKQLGGPYHPQGNSLLFLSEYPDMASFQRSGKATVERITREGLAVTPVKYEIAFACGEAGGP